VVKLLPDKNNVFLTNASFFDKKRAIFIKKNVKEGGFAAFCSLKASFPSAKQLRAS
jgi:hypothetical protein